MALKNKAKKKQKQRITMEAVSAYLGYAPDLISHIIREYWTPLYRYEDFADLDEQSRLHIAEGFLAARGKELWPDSRNPAHSRNREQILHYVNAALAIHRHSARDRRRNQGTSTSFPDVDGQQHNDDGHIDREHENNSHKNTDVDDRDDDNTKTNTNTDNTQDEGDGNHRGLSNNCDASAVPRASTEGVPASSIEGAPQTIGLDSALFEREPDRIPKGPLKRTFREMSSNNDAPSFNDDMTGHQPLRDRSHSTIRFVTPRTTEPIVISIPSSGSTPSSHHPQHRSNTENPRPQPSETPRDPGARIGSTTPKIGSRLSSLPPGTQCNGPGTTRLGQSQAVHSIVTYQSADTQTDPESCRTTIVPRPSTVDKAVQRDLEPVHHAIELLDARGTFDFDGMTAFTIDLVTEIETQEAQCRLDIRQAASESERSNARARWQLVNALLKKISKKLEGAERRL